MRSSRRKRVFSVFSENTGSPRWRQERPIKSDQNDIFVSQSWGFTWRNCNTSGYSYIQSQLIKKKKDRNGTARLKHRHKTGHSVVILPNFGKIRLSSHENQLISTIIAVILADYAYYPFGRLPHATVKQPA